MRYPHILSAFAAEPWAMQREKLEAVASFLVFKARGGNYSPDEVQARISDRRAETTARTAGTIAVVPVHGVISQRVSAMQDISGGVSTDELGATFRAAVMDDTIKAIVLDVDSSGGSTFGMRELANDVRAARGSKPIVAQVNSTAASAAYWLATQADEVVVTPGGVGGSIGVYAVHEDISQMLSNEGVKPTLIKAGDNKGETLNFAPLSADARDAIQARVNDDYGAFVRDVAAGRKVTQKAVLERFGQGRVFMGDEMVSRGMADRVAPLRDTLERLGARPERGSAAATARQAFAAGDTPRLSIIEEHLRDAGFPDALATAFVSLGKGALRRSDSGDEAKIAARLAEGIKAVAADLSGFSLPKRF